MTIEEVKTLFENDNIIKVLFNKKDSSIRTMYCTRNINLVPEENHPKGTGKPLKNPDILKIFDLQKNEWRCFNVNSIISIEAYKDEIPELKEED